MPNSVKIQSFRSNQEHFKFKFLLLSFVVYCVVQSEPRNYIQSINSLVWKIVNFKNANNGIIYFE